MRTSILILAGALSLGCAPTAAAPAAPAMTPTISSCLAAAGEGPDAQRACIGQVNLACQDETDGGVTTAGMVMCAERERAQWAAIGETAAATLTTLESATQTEARERAAAAHTPWMQARCGYDASMYEGGSLARYAAAACVMGETANYALLLHERVIELQLR